MNRYLCTCRSDPTITCILHSTPLKDQIAAALRACDLRHVRQATVAKSIGISVSTMKESLTKENTSWRRLLWAERRERYLQAKADHPRMTVVQLGALIGLTRGTIYNHREQWEKAK